jgi:hypothetical protein
MVASGSTPEINTSQLPASAERLPSLTIIKEEGAEPLAGHKNLLRIIARVQEMPDTFGLCKILATHTSGILHAPQSWDRLNYDPEQLKRSFDETLKERAIRSTNRLTPGPAFTRRYGREGLQLFVNQPLALDDPKKTRDRLLTYQPSNQGLNVGVVLEYPNLKGRHLHWWTVIDVDPKEDTILLGGDFSPINSKAWFNRFPLDNITTRTAQVVGYKGTTALQSTLANTPVPEYRGSFEMNMEELSFTGATLEDKLYQFRI